MSGYGGKDLAILNQCRMFLQAIWLSDICTGDRSAIQITAWQGKRSMLGESVWPIVHNPIAFEWLQWQHALTRLLSLDWWRKLSQPLGPWLPQDQPNRWFYKPTTQ